MFYKTQFLNIEKHVDLGTLYHLTKNKLKMVRIFNEKKKIISRPHPFKKPSSVRSIKLRIMKQRVQYNFLDKQNHITGNSSTSYKKKQL